jgi:hypothetical protein
VTAPQTPNESAGHNSAGEVFKKNNNNPKI